VSHRLLLSSKKKTISLLPPRTARALTAEEPSAEWVAGWGRLHRFIVVRSNYWIVRAAIYILKHQPEIQLSVRAYHGLSDAYLGSRCSGIPGASENDGYFAGRSATRAAPDAQFLLTAGPRYEPHKTRAYDLDKMLARFGDSDSDFDFRGARDRLYSTSTVVWGVRHGFNPRAKLEDQRKVMELVQRSPGLNPYLLERRQ